MSRHPVDTRGLSADSGSHVPREPLIGAEELGAVGQHGDRQHFLAGEPVGGRERHERGKGRVEATRAAIGAHPDDVACRAPGRDPRDRQRAAGVFTRPGAGAPPVRHVVQVFEAGS